jgi:heat shock protein HslJ
MVRRRAWVWLAVMAAMAYGCAKKNNGAPDQQKYTSHDYLGTKPVPVDSIGRGPWRWIATLTPSSRIVCKNPDVYKISFLPDSTIRLLIDCNRGSGPYHISGRSIHIGPFATTRMMCPPGSMDTTFASQLRSANAWHKDADTLQLDTVGESQMLLVR